MADNEYGMESAFRRLEGMAGSDRGLICVAIAAFVERLLREWTGTGFRTGKDLSAGEYVEFISFPDLLRAFETTDQFRAHNSRNGDWQKMHGHLRWMRSLSDKVRHNFDIIDASRYHQVLNNLREFLYFCRPAIRPGDWASMMAALESRADQEGWVDVFRSQSLRLQELETELTRKGLELAAFCKTREELEAARRALEETRAALQVLETAGKAPPQGSSPELKKLKDDMRHMTFQLKEQERVSLKALEAAESRMAQYRGMEEMVRMASEARLFVRSQTSLMETLREPSDEQRRIVESRDSQEGDLLVTGPAGSGKSLVLLLLLERRLARNAGKAEKIALLAFNKPMEKLNRHLLSRGIGEPEGVRAQTVDAFLGEAFRKAFPDHAYFYPGNRTDPDWWVSLLEKHCPPCMKTGDFARELGQLIWDAGYRRDAYLACCRTGMGTPLHQNARRQVWEGVEKVEQELEARNTWPAAWAWYRVLQEKPDADHDLILVDEVQDLGPVRLGILKARSREGLLMAGDAEQMINRPVYTGDDGIWTGPVRRSRLAVSFRNTRPILELAEQVLDRTPAERQRLGIRSEREGVAPLVMALPMAGMTGTLVEQIALFTGPYGYEAETILVISESRELQAIGSALGEKGILNVRVEDGDFGFGSSRGVRLASWNLAKGLTFPVVFVHVRTPPPTVAPRSGDEEENAARRKTERRLLHVACTRAMERLILLVNKESKSHVLQSLAAMAKD